MATKPLMSEAEQRRRQKLQGKIGRTTSALGLTGVGLAGLGAVAAKKPGALAKIPKLKNADPEKLKNAAFHTGIVSGGIGGVGGFNQASIYSAEARRRQQPVKKDLGMDMGYFGEQGTPLAHEEIEKAWQPVASTFNAEASRHRRNKGAEAGLTAASVGTAAAAPVVGHKALSLARQNRTPGQLKAKHLPSVAVKQAARQAKAVKGGKVAAGLAGASVATGIGAAMVHRGRKGSWQSYEKRDSVSAFGVDHVEKAFNPTKVFGALKRPKPPGVLTSERFGDPFAPGKASKPSALPQHAANRLQPKKTAAQLNTPAGHKPVKFSGPRPKDLG